MDIIIYLKVVVVANMVLGGLKRKKFLPIFFFFLFLGCCGCSSLSSCCY
jgi:hypothetical protein